MPITRGPSTALPLASLTTTSLRRTGWISFLWGSVKLAINIGIPHDRLHVFAGFGERNGFDKLLHIAIFPSGLPVLHAIIAGVVSGEGVFESSKLVHHGTKIARTQL